MNKEEWCNFVKGVYKNYISPKLHLLRRKYHPMEAFSYELPRLFRASRSIRFIENNYKENDDLSGCFTHEFLIRIFNDLEQGIHINNALEETGIYKIIDDCFEEFVEGMDINDFPEVDFHALQEAGSYDPKSEIMISIIRIKSRSKQWKYREESIKHLFKETQSIIIKRKEEIKDFNSNTGLCT